MKNEVLETVRDPTVLNILSPESQNTKKSRQETFLMCDFFQPYFVYTNDIWITAYIDKLNLSQRCFHAVCRTIKQTHRSLHAHGNHSYLFEGPWQRHHCNCTNMRKTMGTGDFINTLVRLRRARLCPLSLHELGATAGRRKRRRNRAGMAADPALQTIRTGLN